MEIFPPGTFHQWHVKVHPRNIPIAKALLNRLESHGAHQVFDLGHIGGEDYGHDGQDDEENNDVGSPQYRIDPQIENVVASGPKGLCRVQGPMHQCSTCLKIYTRKSLRSHEDQCRPMFSMCNDRDVLRCAQCNVYFSDGDHLLRHTFGAHEQ